MSTTPSHPTTGAGALPFETASWPRRALALLVDWVVSSLVAAFILGWSEFLSPGGPEQGVVLLVYVVESALLTATVGGSFGKLATRLRTVRVVDDPRPLDLLRSLARQVLVILVVPPLVFKPDGRGLHDLAVGTASVTLQTYRARFVTGR
ncbi:RDD family protein [Nocardioides insulae]|uniref:RDD family protein n=1 Tax=Nocardioides insulae TaxID=394734 RepID=UPI0003F7A26A|nr:RDD family protein [Nocardioides insulae]